MTAAYTTRELKRWDVYYIEKIDEYGGRVGRPAIIISPDSQNQGTGYFVSGIFLTTSPRSGPYYPQITSTGRKSYAVCCEINTIRREHIGSYSCTLTPSEIAAVEQGLMDYLELTDDKDCLERTRMENESLLEKIAELERRVIVLTEEIEAKDLDLKLRDLAYDKVMDRLVEKQIDLDFLKKLAKIPAAPVEEPVAEIPKPVEAAPVEEPSALVDINTCTERELMNLGFTFSVARSIVQARPFVKVDDLRGVQGVTRIAYGLVEKKITVSNVPEVKEPEEPEPKVELVNINTAKAEELHEKLGLNMVVAWSITGTRTREGLYKSVEDLKKVPKFTEFQWKKCEGKVCI